MKVISQGTPKSDRLYRGTCPYCSSIIEAAGKELTLKEDRNDTYYEANCPVCQASVTFELYDSRLKTTQGQADALCQKEKKKKA